MKKTLALAGLVWILSALNIDAAVVTGTVVDNTGNPLTNGVIRFLPASNPGNVSGSTVVGIQKSVNITTNGTFSVSLLTGNYTVTANGYSFGISVPAGNVTNDIVDITSGGLTSFPFHAVAKVSSDDTNPGYLSTKLIEGQGVSLTVLTNGADERLEVAISDAIYTNQAANKLSRASDNGTNLTFYGTNSFLATNATVRLSIEQELALMGQDFRRFGAVGDSSTDNYSAWTNAMARLADGDTLLISDGEFVLDTVDVSKDINIIGVNGGTLKHKDNATGHMLKWTIAGSGVISGVTFNGNTSNQDTNATHAILYTRGALGKGLSIQRNTFNGYMKAAVLDYQTTGRLEISGNSIVNGYKIPLASTNTSIVNAAIWFAPGITNNRANLIVSENWITNSAPSASDRLPGGVIIFGAESVNAFNWAEVKHNYFDYVGGDSTAPSWHVGTAVVDWYRHTRGIMGWNFATNSQYYVGKIQQSPDVQIIGNHGHSTGAGVYNITPGEREQTNAFRHIVFRDNWAYIGTNDTIGLYLNAGDEGGFYDVFIDGFHYDGTRGIQIEGFDQHGNVEGYGPVTLKNLDITASTYGIRVLGMAGTLSIEDAVIDTTSTASAIFMIQTNTAAKVVLRNVAGRAAGSGWGARIWGVNSLSAEHCYFSSASGEAVELQDDADGNNIANLFWENNNVTSGTVDVVVADIDSGYYGNGLTTTWYPNGFTTQVAPLTGRMLYASGDLDGFINLRAENTSTNTSATAGFHAQNDQADTAQWGIYGSGVTTYGRNAFSVFGANVPRFRQNMLNTSGTFAWQFNGTDYLSLTTSGLQFPYATATTVPYLDASKRLQSSAVTPTELGYVSGVTSALQTQLNAKNATITVQEEDGSPAVTPVTTIRVANGTLTDNGGGSVSISTGGGGGGTNLSQILVNGSTVSNVNLKDGTNSVIWAVSDSTNVFGFPTNILGNQIFDGTIAAADLGTDSVSADELNASGVEAELEAVLDLQDQQGAVVAAQVPDILAFDILTVNDDAYAAGWNASTNVPTKNAIYDKIESLSLGTSIYVNGSSVSAPNLASGTNLIWAVSDSTNVYGFPTNIVASQLATDSVSADELNATGVEAELEAVLDLNELQGQIADAQIADGAVDGGTGGEIADASVTAADLATDSVSADELNAAGVEAELEAVLDLQDMQGAVIAAQVPDDLAFDDLTANTLVVSNTISAGSGNGQIDLGAAGVRMTSDGDGAITFLGLGNGSDEDLTLNLDDTANTGVFSSSTGLNVLSLSSIDLQVPTEVYGAGWDADNTVPTKDAVYDKIEAIVGASGDQVLINGSGITNPNFMDGTNSVIFAIGDATNVFAFPTNILGNQIFDGTVAAADLGTDSVSADELNATGVETELEAVLDLDQMQGQIGDAQIADGAVDGGTGGEIADASITDADITATLDLGGKTSLEIPNGNDPNTSVEGQLSWDNNGDVLRGYDGTRQVAIGRVIEAIHVTVIAPNDLADAQRDAFLFWSNESGMSFVITGWKGWSGTDDTTLNIETTAADGSSNATVDAVELATGAGPYTGSDTTITAGTIANGSLLWLDFDDTDAPTYVKMTIYGYYDADVN